jgi:hypothetical protein
MIGVAKPQNVSPVVDPSSERLLVAQDPAAPPQGVIIQPTRLPVFAHDLQVDGKRVGR